MSVLVAFTIGMVWFIMAWSLGVKAFDAFMLTMLITLVAVTARLMMPAIMKFVRPE